MLQKSLSQSSHSTVMTQSTNIDWPVLSILLYLFWKGTETALFGDSFTPSLQVALVGIVVFGLFQKGVGTRSPISPLGYIVFALLMFVVFVPLLVHSNDYLIVRDKIALVLVFTLFITRRNWSSVFGSFRIFAYIFCFVTLCEAAIFSEEIWRSGRLASMYNSPNVTGSVAALLSAVVIMQDRGRTRVLTLVAIAAIVLLTKSRTSIVILACCSLFAFFVKFRSGGRLNRIHLTFFFTSIVGVGVGLYDVIKDSITRNQSFENMTTLTGRTEIWEFYFRKIEENLWFGNGSESYVYKVWNRWYKDYEDNTGGAHNLWISLTAAEGVVTSTILALVCILCGSFCILQATKKTPSNPNLRDYYTISASLFIGVFIQSFSERFAQSAVSFSGISLYLLIVFCCFNHVEKCASK